MALQTITQAAKELGLTETHVRNMIRNGAWPVYRFGNKSKGMRLDVEEIKAIGRQLAEDKQGRKRK